MPRMPSPERPAPRINQQTLAERLQLSIATISRSLQDHPDIAPGTKQRVIAEAERLGYRRKAGPTVGNAIGVLISGAEQAGGISPLNTSYLMGMSHEAQTRGLMLMTHYLSGIGDHRLLETTTQPVALAQGALSGLILVHRFQPDVVRELARQRPVVSLAHAYPGSGADLIDSDHLAGMETLVVHLARLGHRRFGYLMRSNSSIPFSRLGSLVRAVTLHGLAMDSTLYLDLPLDTAVAENRLEATPEILAAQGTTIDRLITQIRAGTTAWACDSDATAYWIHRLLTARGIRIPEDVSLTGFDGFDPYPGCPQVTTIRVPFTEMARHAIIRLAERRNPGSVSQNTPQLQIQLAGTLVPGSTSAQLPV
jgi:LacI family transcriptional regulator